MSHTREKVRRFLIRVMSRAHGGVYRASRGRLLGHLAGMPVLLLTTTGRRSGRRRTVALSNWSAEMFPVARKRFGFLGWFEGIVISGVVGVNKPDRRIFDHLTEQFGIEPAAALFIDDSSANVEAAKALGYRAIRFTDATALRRELVRLGLLPDTQAVSPAG